MMMDVFGRLIKAALELGEINQALMYESGFMTIEGKTNAGKKFSVTLHINEEEEKDGN